MIPLLILLGFTIVGFLVVLDRRDKRAHEDRQAHRLEVAGLLSRMRSLELAPAEPKFEPSEGPLFSNEYAELEEHLEALSETANGDR